MQSTTTHISPILQLNDDPKPRHYTAEVFNMVKQGEKKTYTAVVQEFDLCHLGIQAEQLRHYQMKTKARFFLNDRYNIIKKLDKAQNIGLKVASINDLLEFAVSPQFKCIKIANPQTIRDAWQRVSEELLEEHPDLNKMVENFNQQLQDENIQQIYGKDNFFNFFFANIFQQKTEDGEMTPAKRMLAEAVEHIAIPIIEKRKINPADTSVVLTAEMDTEHPNFPMQELTTFLGSLPAEPGSQQSLKLDYSGMYKVDPKLGLIAQGSLTYTFSIGDLYEKTMIINFNLDSHG